MFAAGFCGKRLMRNFSEEDDAMQVASEKRRTMMKIRVVMDPVQVRLNGHARKNIGLHLQDRELQQGGQAHV